MTSFQTLGKKEMEEFDVFLQELELKSVRFRFSEITQYCFDSCVNKFTKHKIQNNEKKCIESCVDKYANAWDRCIRRWQEITLNQQGKQIIV